MALSNAELQRRYRERRNDLAALVDLKAHTRIYRHPGTAEHGKPALAFLVALARHGAISEAATDDALQLRLSGDRANLPDEAQLAAWQLRQWVCPDDQRTDMIDVTVRLGASPQPGKPTKRKPRQAAKRKRK